MLAILVEKVFSDCDLAYFKTVKLKQTIYVKS